MLLWPMTTGVYIYFQISVVVFFFFFFADIYPEVELLGHTVVLVCFLWTLHTAFHSGCTSLHSFISTVYRVPFSPRSCKHAICVFFFFLWHPFWQLWGEGFWFASPWWLAMLRILCLFIFGPLDTFFFTNIRYKVDTFPKRDKKQRNCSTHW